MVVDGELGQGAEGAWVGGVVVAAEHDPALGEPADPEHIGHLVADGPGVGPAQLELEPGTPSPLGGSHATLAAQRRVGETVEEVGVAADQDVEVEGEVLTPLEALEAVEGDRLLNRGLMEPLEEQAMAA